MCIVFTIFEFQAMVNHDIDALREKRNSKKAKHAKRSDY